MIKRAMGKKVLWSAKSAVKAFSSDFNLTFDE